MRKNSSTCLLIERNANCYTLFNQYIICSFQSNLISHTCLEDIINLPQSIKDAMYTELYFYHYEPNIAASLKNSRVWDFLLANNRTDLLKLWIDLNYDESENSIVSSDEHRSDIQLLLANLKITDAMVDSVESSNGMLPINNLILNYLSR